MLNLTVKELRSILKGRNIDGHKVKNRKKF